MSRSGGVGGVALRNESSMKDRAQSLDFPTHLTQTPREMELLLHTDFESPNQLGSLQVGPDRD